METKIAQDIRKKLRYRGYTKIVIARTQEGGSDYYHVTAEDPITHNEIAFGFHIVEEDQKGNSNGRSSKNSQ